MTKLRILVAASVGIAAENWLKAKLKQSIPEDSIVNEIGKNKYLSNALSAIGLASNAWPKITALRKSEIRNALNDADHLLLFWDGRTFTELLFEARLRNIPTKVFPFQVTEVVNKEKDNDFDAYIGRGTLWGNPFQVGQQEGQFERHEAIEKYKDYFEKKILGDESMHKGILGLRGMRIACHCKPLACHGDVIAGYLNALNPEDFD